MIESWPDAPGFGPGEPLIVFDVGGTNVKYGVVDRDGTLSGMGQVRTVRSEIDPAGALVEQLALTVREIRERTLGLDGARIALAVPGLVDEREGLARYSENLGWRDAPLAELLAARADTEVVLSHDVRVAGYAEWRLGAAGERSDAAVIAIGTGVSAAIFVDGRPIVASGYAGEIGHLRVASEDESCVCGGRGCVEALGSGAAIVRRYRRLAGADAVSEAEEVVRLAASGDPHAERVWIDAVEAISFAVTTISSVAGSEIIVLAGGVSGAGAELSRSVATSVRRRNPVRCPEVVTARFGRHAGLVGAALAVRERRRYLDGAPNA